MNKRNRIVIFTVFVVIFAMLMSFVGYWAYSFGSEADKAADSRQNSGNSSQSSVATEVGSSSVNDSDFEDYYNSNVDEAISRLPKNDSGALDGSEEIPEALTEFAKEKGLSVSIWPEELIEMLNNNPETKEFVLNYPMYKDTSFDIDLSEVSDSTSVPLFLQWDQRWGYTDYGDDMIAIAGCGPTCLSMVCVHLLGDTTLNPKVVAEFSEDNGYCVAGNGSKWSLISEGGELLGLNVQELPLDEELIYDNLENGNPIICIMGPGDFTESGHFIVMTEYVNDQIKINDPNSISHSEKLWSYEDIMDQIDDLWACSVY